MSYGPFEKADKGSGLGKPVDRASSNTIVPVRLTSNNGTSKIIIHSMLHVLFPSSSLRAVGQAILKDID